MGIAELFLKSAKYAREKTALTMKSLRNHEFDHVKIDGTVRLLRRVKGQADFLCSAATRAIAPLNDADSIRRIISFIGRTGSVLALKLRRDEAALTIADTLRDEFPLECRQQISTISVDFCTPAMWESLSNPDVCPNLHLLCLDATHICMKYRAAFGRRKTEGCVWLSRVMAKFSKANDMLGVFHWGAPYHGDRCRPLSLAESNARQQLVEGNPHEHALRWSLAYQAGVHKGSLCCVLRVPRRGPDKDSGWWQIHTPAVMEFDVTTDVRVVV